MVLRKGWGIEKSASEGKSCRETFDLGEILTVKAGNSIEAAEQGVLLKYKFKLEKC